MKWMAAEASSYASKACRGGAFPRASLQPRPVPGGVVSDHTASSNRRWLDVKRSHQYQWGGGLAADHAAPFPLSRVRWNVLHGGMWNSFGGRLWVNLVNCGLGIEPPSPPAARVRFQCSGLPPDLLRR